MRHDLSDEVTGPTVTPWSFCVNVEPQVRPAFDKSAATSFGRHYRVLMATFAGQTFPLEAFPLLQPPTWFVRRTNVIELPGGHSPLLSRPGALAEVLLSSVE